MAIKSIHILNVMVFQKRGYKNNRDCKDVECKAGDSASDAFCLDFCDGINVLIGENGVGKNTILKMIYAATQLSYEENAIDKAKRLHDFFFNNIKDSEALKSAEHIMANILLELQKNGVQIFIATHSYNFAKYLEIRRSDLSMVMFHNLYKGISNLSDTVKVEMIADNKLLDEVFDM